MLRGRGVEGYDPLPHSLGSRITTKSNSSRQNTDENSTTFKTIIFLSNFPNICLSIGPNFMTNKYNMYN